jgi:hypothetical protein
MSDPAKLVKDRTPANVELFLQHQAGAFAPPIDHRSRCCTDSKTTKPAG